jgi:hypothetical protein
MGWEFRPEKRFFKGAFQLGSRVIRVIGNQEEGYEVFLSPSSDQFPPAHVSSLKEVLDHMQSWPLEGSEKRLRDEYVRRLKYDLYQYLK